MFTSSNTKWVNKLVYLSHPLFPISQQNRENSKAQEEGRAAKGKEPGSLSDLMECCPFTKNFSWPRNKFLVSEATEIPGNISKQWLILPWLVQKRKHCCGKEDQAGRHDNDPYWAMVIQDKPVCFHIFQITICFTFLFSGCCFIISNNSAHS